MSTEPAPRPRSAKEVQVRPIPCEAARAVISALHYSGTYTNNAQVHLGAFLDGKLQGAMSFGPPIDRSKLLHLVAGSEWGSMLELNRMAFGDGLPRNSESRCLAVASQCGDGTIYRASGFVLTQIKPMTLHSGPHRPRPELGGRTFFEVTGGVYSFDKYCKAVGAEPLPGFQLRYIKFIDPTWRARLTCPELPFERIAELGASMYRGQKR